jgi:hypothetical protein
VQYGREMPAGYLHEIPPLVEVADLTARPDDWLAKYLQLREAVKPSTAAEGGVGVTLLRAPFLGGDHR